MCLEKGKKCLAGRCAGATWGINPFVKDLSPMACLWKYAHLPKGIPIWKREGRRENLSFSATLAQLISGDAGMTFKLVTPSHWSHIDMAALLGCHPSCRGLCQQLGKSPSFLKGGLEDITACIPGALYFNDLIWGSFEAGMGAVNNFVLQQPWGPVTCLP